MRPDGVAKARGVDVAAAIAAFALGLAGLRCLDVWIHLRTGQMIWQTGAIPTADSLSHTRAGAPWVTHEWAFELPLYGIWELGGDPAMVGVQAALAALTFGVLVRACLNAGASRSGAFVAALAGAFVASTRFLARPHMASALFTALLLAWGFRHRRTPDRRIACAIPLILLWANMHGGVIQGLFLLGLFALDEWVRERRAGVVTGVTVAAGLASLVNPHGWEALWYPFFLLRANDAGLFDIVELRPPDFPSPVHVYAGALVLAAGVGWRKLGLVNGGLAIVGIVLGLTRRRATLDLALYGAPLLAVGWSEGVRLLARIGGRGVGIPPLAAALAAVGALLGATHWRPNLDVVPWAIPAGAMRFVETEKVGGQMLNSHAFGGWILWAYPDRKVYFDGRNEVFVDLFRETQETPVATLATRYDLGYAVFEYPGDEELGEVELPVDLHDVLVADPGWSLVYFDDVARLFLRDRAENHDAIARHAYHHLRPGWQDFEYIRRYVASPELAPLFEAEARRAVAAAPDAAMPRMHHVEFLRLSGRIDEAIAELAHVPEGDPFRISRAGSLLLQAGRVSEALVDLEAAATRLPGNATIWSNLGLARMRSADQGGAITALREAIRIAPDLLEASENLALALDRTGDAAGAAAERQRAGAVRERLARAHFEVGQKLLEGGYAERAAVELERAAAVAPRAANVRYLLGVAYNAMGEPARAEHALTACLSLDAAHPYALLELADARMAQGHADEARGMLTAFLASGPEPRWRTVALRKLDAIGEGGTP